LGCGHGICASEGTHCVCNPGYAYANYLMNIPDCWNATNSRTIVLASFTAIVSLHALFDVFLSFQLRQRMRKMAIATALTSFFSVGLFVAMFLEGFFGIISATFMTIASMFVLTSVSIMFISTFEPVTRIGKLKNLKGLQLHHLLAVQVVLLGLIVYVVWIPPYVSALQNDWRQYNERSLGFMWAGALGLLFIVALPYIYILGAFKAAVTSMNEVANEMNNVSPDADKQRQLTTRLVGYMTTLRNVFIVSSVFVFSPAVYCTGFWSRHGQVPLLSLMFVFLVGGAALVSFGNSFFLWRVWRNPHVGLSSSEHRRSKRFGSKEFMSSSKSLRANSKDCIAAEEGTVNISDNSSAIVVPMS
jgi:hypothetical protein